MQHFGLWDQRFYGFAFCK